MLRSRVVPVLLLLDGALVKTVKFREGAYIGDPLNAVRIFNEKEVDELCVLDIGASRDGHRPDLELIERIADECRMPLTYGGGLERSEEAARILRLGVEKVAVGSAASKRPRLLAEFADAIGQQSVVGIVNTRRRRSGRSEVVGADGRERARRDPVEVAREFISMGAGEVLVHSVDRDGTMAGYDLELARSVRAAISSPVTIVGGAGSVDDIGALVDAVGPVGAGVGSLFVFKGRFKAVLINYARPPDA